MVADCAFSQGIQIALLVQSYGHFAELVDFAYWWSFIGKGLRLKPPQQAIFFVYLGQIQYLAVHINLTLQTLSLREVIQN